MPSPEPFRIFTRKLESLGLRYMVSGSVAADEKSLAVRLVFSRDDATLTDNEIEPVLKQVLARLADQVAARLRA